MLRSTSDLSESRLGVEEHRYLTPVREIELQSEENVHKEMVGVITFIE